jgi:hypothetical protein
MRSDNKSGVKGIVWYKKDKKWRAQIFLNGKQVHIGDYNNLEDATIARQNKAREDFGVYINKCEV